MALEQNRPHELRGKIQLPEVCPWCTPPDLNQLNSQMVTGKICTPHYTQLLAKLPPIKSTPKGTAA